MKGLLLAVCVGLLLPSTPAAAGKPKKKLIKVTKHALVPAQPIAFDAGTARIDKTSLPALDAAAKILVNNETIELRIEVHSDSQGSSSFNRRITQQRANAIARYLTKHGVKAKRLDPRGYGEDKPIASNRTAAGRAKNRRVELVIVDR